MEPDEHVGESAELYAFGALEPAQRAAVERHIARCTRCLRRVGEAEETVLALERANVADAAAIDAATAPAFGARRVPILWLPLAAAAALIIGLLMPRPLPQADRATLAMIGSHFSHAQFVGPGPPAKVLYARDRSWFYVIVEGRHRYEVAGVRDGALTPLGHTAPNAETSALFAGSRTAFDRLELRENGAVVETASIR